MIEVQSLPQGKQRSILPWFLLFLVVGAICSVITESIYWFLECAAIFLVWIIFRLQSFDRKLLLVASILIGIAWFLIFDRLL